MTAPRKKNDPMRWESLFDQLARHGTAVPRRSARDAVAIGMDLLTLKAALPHGAFLNKVNALGIPASLAQRHMGSARRFAQAPDAFFDAVGSATKLFELLPLADYQELMHGEAVHGLTLERIKPMTVLVLRKAVRTACTRAAGVEVLLLTPPKPVRLSVDDERMLRLFRQCRAPAREALFSVAALLAQP